MYILFEKLIKSHCFHNANERTAVLVLLVFFKRNNWLLKVEDKELEDITVEVAVNDVLKEKLVDWLLKNSIRCEV
ncbi:type II toxin-antitoxin system death-on-curing family toxin [Enterococcus sp. LJL99]